MDSIKIFIFDEEELTKTLIESYLCDVLFPYTTEKYNEFDEGLINSSDENKIIIVNINRLNDDLLNKISENSKNPKNKFLIISYDTLTDLRVKAIRAGAVDFLLKPLIKSDFLYSLQHIYKNIISDKTKEKGTLSLFMSNIPDKDNSVFMYNLAKEAVNIQKGNVLIIDFPLCETNIADLMKVPLNLTEINNFSNNIKQDIDSSLYILNCKMENITKTSLNCLYKEVQNNYKNIFVNIPENMPDDIKKLFLEDCNNFYYVISQSTGSVEKTKNDIKNLLNKKSPNFIIIDNNKKNNFKVERFKTCLDAEIFHTISANYTAFEKVLMYKKTYNELNKDYEIAKEYVNLANKVINRK